MMDFRFETEAASQFFNTLPPIVQETLKQSGMTSLTEEQLRASAKQILGGETVQ